MRYLDYSFDKPILPQPLETLEILYFVVLTLSWHLNICVGRLGQSIFWNSVDYHFSKEITATCMRYLDYCFNKPTLPSPLETLEILCLVVVTLSWYHNIRKGARGDRFFGSRSITAIFPLEKWRLAFLFVLSVAHTELRLWRHFLKLKYSSTALYYGYSLAVFICMVLFERFWAVAANRTCLFGVNLPRTGADFISVLEHWLKVFEMVNPMKLKSVDFIAK